MGASRDLLKTRPVIKCPRCAGTLESAAAHCVACGYSLAVADTELGAGPVWAARVMDPDGFLTPARREAMERALTDFERALPQMFFLVYLGPLPPGIPVASFGFWLLNQAAVPELDAWRANERGLMLTVDTTRHTAALTAGYFVENHLTAAELHAVLQSGAAALGAGDPAKAVTGMTGALIRHFRARARSLAREGVTAAPLPHEMPENAPVFRPLEPLRGPSPVLADAPPAPLREPAPEDVFTEEWEIPIEPEPEAAAVAMVPEPAPVATPGHSSREDAGKSIDAPEAEQEQEPVAGLVKKRAKAKSRHHRHRRG